MSQTTTPLVSVIIRTKDRLTLLKQALNSVVEQTYPMIELIVVNDGGIDVADEIAVIEPFVTTVILEQLSTNLGRTVAANRGLECATGDYICFLDDDDYWLSCHLEDLVKRLVQEDADVAYSGTKVLEISTAQTLHEINEYNVGYDSLRLRYENFLPIHSVLFSRKYIEQGIRFDEHFDLFEDWDFWLQLSQHTEFIHHPRLTAVYCLHAEASGVHQSKRVREAYGAIYRKWLTHDSLADIYTLLQQSHQWHDHAIESLQEDNKDKLDVIGIKHSQALVVIQEREEQLRQAQLTLAQLGKTHDYAQSVVQERDQQLSNVQSQLEQLGKEHTHAQKVVKERDAQLQEKDTVLQEKDTVLKEKDTVLQKKDVELQKKDKTIEKLDMELEKIKSSKLWPLYRRLLK